MDSSAESITGLVKALRERAGLSMDAVAKTMGYQAASSYQRYENPALYKGGYLRRDWVAKFAKALDGKGSPPVEAAEVWLLAGPEFAPKAPRELTYEPLPEHDPSWRPQADFDGEAYSREEWRPKIPGALPEIDLRYGAGEGSVGEVMALRIGAEAYSGHKIIDEWPFPASFLHSLGANTSQSIVGEVIGDSMLPNYLPGDRVIVDLAQNAMMADGVYVFTDGHSPPQIKRLQRRPFTDPPLVAIISDNPAYDSAEVELSQVRILGKVVWHLGRR